MGIGPAAHTAGVLFRGPPAAVSVEISDSLVAARVTGPPDVLAGPRMPGLPDGIARIPLGKKV